jgi:hypothetical protein
MTLTSIENIENLHLGETRARKHVSQTKEAVVVEEKEISKEVEPLLKVRVFREFCVCISSLQILTRSLFWREGLTRLLLLG